MGVCSCGSTDTVWNDMCQECNERYDAEIYGISQYSGDHDKEIFLRGVNTGMSSCIKALRSYKDTVLLNLNNNGKIGQDMIGIVEDVFTNSLILLTRNVDELDSTNWDEELNDGKDGN